MAEIFLEHPEDYLHLELRLRKERRPAYSMRALARDLQMSPASLATFLGGGGGMSEERAKAIARNLKWAPERFEHFWDLVQAKYSPKPERRFEAAGRVEIRLKHLNSHISADSFRLMSDWRCLAVLTLLQMNPVGVEPDSIGRRLEFQPEIVAESLATLERLSLAENRLGSWFPARQITHSGDDGPSDAIRHFHHQLLDLAHEALEKQKLEDRENLSIIYSIEERHLPKIRTEIREAVLKILSDYSRESKDDAIQALTLQMFSVMPSTPATQPATGAPK